MSAGLDRDQQTGVATVFSVRESMWHREGHVLTSAPSHEEARRLAGHNFPVLAEPVYTREPDGTFKAHDEFRAIVRGDRRTVFAVPKKTYRPVQNEDGFRIFEPLIDSGVAEYATGGTLNGGADVWMMIKFNITDPVVREVYADEIVPYGLAANNHSTERRLVLKPCDERVVCRNTLAIALNDRHNTLAISIAHRGDPGVRIVEAAERLFAGLTDRYRRIALDYKAMKETILTVEQFTKSVLDVVVPMPVESAFENGKRFMTACDKALDRRAVIRDKWETGSGHVGDHSAWEAYNGAVEVIDHDDETFPVRGGSRVRSAMEGRIGEIKGDLRNSVLALVRR